MLHYKSQKLSLPRRKWHPLHTRRLTLSSNLQKSVIWIRWNYYRRRGRVSKGVGHFAHVWSCGVREVVSSNPDLGNIVGWVFHPTRWLAQFSLIWKCLSFQILNLLRTLSSWGSGNYRPSAPFPYEVASHVKQLPFRPLLLLLLILLHINNKCW